MSARTLKWQPNSKKLKHFKLYALIPPGKLHPANTAVHAPTCTHSASTLPPLARKEIWTVSRYQYVVTEMMNPRLDWRIVLYRTKLGVASVGTSLSLPLLRPLNYLPVLEALGDIRSSLLIWGCSLTCGGDRYWNYPWISRHTTFACCRCMHPKRGLGSQSRVFGVWYRHFSFILLLIIGDTSTGYVVPSSSKTHF